eukprot:GHVH01005187.1.p1 GENE.GHVH01005187.1~~GHVH01005187.1.p1  ORF type:complete len:368 (+),score=27.30 GHVH01005187.1:65-1168(+)
MRKIVKQCLCIAAYMTTSISIVYFNRQLFTVIYPFPVFISWVQQIIGVALYYLMALMGRLTNIPLFKRFHLIKVDFWVLYKCFPQVVTFTLMVGLANLCLEYVQVSTYQVARSLSLIFSIILTRYLLGTFPSRMAMIGVCLICSGFVLNSLDPETLSFFGLVLGASSSFFQSFNGVLVSKNMSLFENDGQKLLLYNLVGASVTMFPLIFIFGESDAFTFLPLNPADEMFIVRWCALLGSGAFCILINLSTFMVIDATSPVSMTVIGFSKSIVQSIGGIFFFGDIVTPESLMALFMSFFGTGMYTFAQVFKQKLPNENPTDFNIDSRTIEGGLEINEASKSYSPRYVPEVRLDDNQLFDNSTPETVKR